IAALHRAPHAGRERPPPPGGASGESAAAVPRSLAVRSWRQAHFSGSSERPMRTPRALSRIVERGGGAGRLGIDGWRALAGLSRTLLWTLAPPRDEPCLALLEGEPVARVGTMNAYRVRVYNPSPSGRALSVVLPGLREGHQVFQHVWILTLEAQASAERWVGTRWTGDIAVLREPPAHAAFPGPDAVGLWAVEAELAEVRGEAHGALRIEG